MRVLLVVDSYSKNLSGGLVAHHTADTLVQAGYIVGVFCYGPGEDVPGVKYFQKLSSSSALKHIWPGEEISEFKQVIAEFKPDVVHFCSFEYGKSRFLIEHSLAVGARVILQPWIYNFFCEQSYDYRLGKSCGLCASGNFMHSLLHRCGPLKSALIHAFSRHLLRKTSLRCHSVLSSNATMDVVLHKYGFSKEKLVAVPVPFAPKRVEGLPVQDGRDFIFYGQVRDFKGAHLLLDALGACPQTEFSIYPAISDEGERLKKQFDKCRVRNVQVTMGLNWNSGLAERVACCRAVLLPSLWPTTPEYVLFEAMGLSKPVVAFNVGAHKEILVNRKNAMVVPCGDVRAFRAAIIELDNNPALRHEIGVGARKTFEKLTDSKLFLNRLVRAYTA